MVVKFIDGTIKYTTMPVQQFIIFTENVEKASLFLSETFLQMLFHINFVIFHAIHVPEISQSEGATLSAQPGQILAGNQRV